LGGKKLNAIIPNPDFENADHIFSSDKVVIELNNMRTEFGKTNPFQTKYERIHDKSLLSLDKTVTGEYFRSI
jgi:hypothetical protein